MKRVVNGILVALLGAVMLLGTSLAENRGNITINIPISIQRDYEEIDRVQVQLTAVEEGNPLPSNSLIELKEEGKFEGLTYDAPGNYNYKISQIKGSNQDILYDATVYDVSVSIWYDTSNNYKSTVVIKNEDSNRKSEVKFVNTKIVETESDKKGENKPLNQSVQTGDNTRVLEYLVLLIVSLVLLVRSLAVKSD